MSKDVLQPGAAAGAGVTISAPIPLPVDASGNPITIQEPLTVDALDGTFFVRSAAASTFPVNIGRVGGTATDVNAGNAGAGTQRVVLATDQPTVPVSIAATVPVSIAAAVEVTTDADAPPLVAVDDPAMSSGIARWQADVVELLIRQTEALEAMALAIVD